MIKKRISHFLLLSVFIVCSVFVHAQVIKGNYAIKNVETEKLLRIKDANGSNGTPLVLYYPQNWKCMTWEFRNVEGQTYQLKNLFTGKTFQPKGGTASKGTRLEQQPLNSASAIQLYEFIRVDNDVYLIKLKGTDLYVTAVDKKGTVNSGIELQEKNGSKLQQWTIYEQSPTM
jgi:hypothetical protein